MKYEFQKLLRQRVLFIFIVAVLAAVYVFLAFYGTFELFCGMSISYFWAHEDYRQFEMSQFPETVDDAWIDSLKAEYKTFVDENMVSTDEIIDRIASQARGDYIVEDVLSDPYNIQYAYVVLSDEAYLSREMEYRYYAAFKTYIPLAEDPVGYIHNRLSDDVLRDEGYSEQQREDCGERVDRIYSDFQLTVGYSLGWDVLCAVMQYLPFTLGMALIVVLGNLFSQERSTEMTAILRTTKNGRTKLLRKKLMAAMLLATGLWLFFQLSMLLAVSLTYTLQGANCTAMCFSQVPSFYGVTWGQYYIVQSLFSYFGTLTFALLVCCLSSLLKLRLSMPIQIALTLVTGIVIDKFAYADRAFGLWEKLRMLTPAQLMEAYPTMQVYQSYQFGNIIIPLPMMMVAAIVIETVVMLLFLRYREGECGGPKTRKMRFKNQSSVAGAAYQSGTSLFSEYDQKRKSYTPLGL
jgi:hypothetical protein